MIRRRVGDAFWLVRQQDHAALAAALAAEFGNRQFAGPASPQLAAATAAHEDGWAAFDDAPVPDAAGRPWSAFDAPRAVEHAAWLASADAAAVVGAYAGLIVALHGLSLSAVAAGQMPAERFDDEQRRRQFDLNKVQHALIERIEKARTVLRYAVDRPLRLGLADGWATPAEDALRFDLRLLQACHALSLHACCDVVPASRAAVQPFTRPGGGTASLAVGHVPGAITVRPWPFASEAVSTTIPYRPVQAVAYSGANALRATLAAAPEQRFAVTFRPG